VALSPPIKSAIEGRINNKTVHLIPNMSDTCFYYPSERDLQVEQEFQVQGRFVVTYAGALGYANGLDYLLRCAGVCQAGQLPVSFLIFGDGAEGAGLQRTAMQLGLRNIAFLPFQDRVGVRKIFSITDAVFVCYRPVAILETGSPNKYFDGLSAGKLIVVNFSGWIREEIERESCGIYVDPINAGSFVDGIGPFMNDKPLLKRYQNNSRRLAEQKYSRNELSKKFVEVISGSRQGHLLSTS
jgi:glycosyltransferase involved in cell wall biosynthesis